ncbi:MAG TPA: hypothetical protein VJ044_01785, partial [Candidatus Hodarchaeales archaeon]|nr:hypothetical protein [Candidatus Hodarchaeales archaeon]
WLELSVLGINYTHLLYVSAILFSLGVGLGLSTMKGPERDYISRLRLVWLMLILIGLLLNLYAILGMFENFEWEKWFYLSIFFSFFGVVFLFGSMKAETRNEIGGLWPLLLLLTIVGFLSGITSNLGVYQLGGPIGLGDGYRIGTAEWNHYFVYGLPFTVLGLIPLAYVLSAREGAKEKLHKGWVLWLVMFLIGLGIFLAGAIEILTDTSILGIEGLGKDVGIAAAIPFALYGAVLFFSSSGDKAKNLVRKSIPLGVLITLAGLGTAGLGRYLSDTFPNSTLGLGLVIVIFGAGILYKGLSLDFEPSLPVARSLSGGTARDGTMADAGSGDFLQKFSPEESTLFLNIQKKSAENAIAQFGTALRSGKISQVFYSTVADKYQAQISNMDNEIASVEVSSRRSTRKSIFEEELGIKKPAPAKSSRIETPPTRPIPSSP